MNPGERDAFVRGFSLAVNPLKFGSSGLFFYNIILDLDAPSLEIERLKFFIRQIEKIGN